MGSAPVAHSPCAVEMLDQWRHCGIGTARRAQMRSDVEAELRPAHGRPGLTASGVPIRPFSAFVLGGPSSTFYSPLCPVVPQPVTRALQSLGGLSVSVRQARLPARVVDIGRPRLRRVRFGLAVLLAVLDGQPGNRIESASPRGRPSRSRAGYCSGQHPWSTRGPPLNGWASAGSVAGVGPMSLAAGRAIRRSSRSGRS